MEQLNRQQKKDIRLLATFVQVYCQGKHSGVATESRELPDALGESNLCQECRTFLDYAISRRLKCPLEAEKPTCKHCRIHCYAREQRIKVREIMGYAGRRLMMRGRFDYLWHYFF